MDNEQYVIFEYDDGSTSPPLSHEQAAPLYDCMVHLVGPGGMPRCGTDGLLREGEQIKPLAIEQASSSPIVSAGVTENPLLSTGSDEGPGFLLPVMIAIALVAVVGVALGRQKQAAGRHQ